MLRQFYRHLLLVVALIAMTGNALAGPKVEVVVGATAPELERFAATELAAQLTRLFEAEVNISTKLSKDSKYVVLLGTAQTNPAIGSLSTTFPKLSDQGHLLRSVKVGDQQALVVSGGSPVATLWAVYELGQRFGIRYALFGDMFPAVNPEFKLDGFDVVLEPALKVRSWRTINDFPIGPEAWGLAEHEALIKQLAKLKYNRLMLSIYPWQPFVDYEFQGVKKETALLWFGYRYPVDGDTAGRAVFKGAKFFENPDFVGKNTYQERIAAGTTQARGIISAARKLGMSTTISFSPLEFPREFAKALPGAKQLTGLEQLTIGPGSKQGLSDPTLMGLVKTQIRAFLTTYPEIDGLYLSMPEFPEWGEHAEAAFQALDQRTGLGKSTSLEKLTAAARDRKVTTSSERGAQALRGNLATLEFFNQILADKELLRLPGGRTAQIRISDIDPALFPYLEQVLPAGTGAHHFIDYTARRVAENAALLKTVPARKVPSTLILTLADDNVGVLPQMSFTSLKTLLDGLHSEGWDGFSTRYWIVGDLDFSAYYLSRASFEPTLTPQKALEEFTEASLGQGTYVRTIKAFELIEQATTLIDQNDIGFSFPVPNVLMKHYVSTEPVPEWMGQASNLYAEAMNEMYRVNTRTRDGNRDFSLYLARRCEFGMEYLNCVQAIRRAGIAKGKGDDETRIAELEKALESLHGGLNALSAVARSNCDRGIIAVLNEYGYRPLKKELEAE